MLRRAVDRALETLAIRSGRARRHFASQRGKLRVVTYHGLIPDGLADPPWVPSHLVTVSQFDRHMAMLAGLGGAHPLGEAMARIRGDQPGGGPLICVTFDDGTADNLTLALPILERYGHRATFFLATGHVDRRELTANDVIRLLREAHKAGRLNGSVSPRCRAILTEPGLNKTRSLLSYRAELYDLWTRNQAAVDPCAVRSLQMMSWDDARILCGAGMEIGAHTVNHVILAREDRATRDREIAESVERVRAESGQRDVPFAYPNGQIGDYDNDDIHVLTDVRVSYAVTQQPGWNTATSSPLELRRNCVGRHGSDQAFLAQVFGLRDSCGGRRPAA